MCPAAPSGGVCWDRRPESPVRGHSSSSKKKKIGFGRRHMWAQTPALPLSSGGLGHVTGPFCTWFTFAKCIFSIILLMHINFPLRSVMVGE